MNHCDQLSRDALPAKGRMDGQAIDIAAPAVEAADEEADKLRVPRTMSTFGILDSGRLRMFSQSALVSSLSMGQNPWVSQVEVVRYL